VRSDAQKNPKEDKEEPVGWGLDAGYQADDCGAAQGGNPIKNGHIEYFGSAEFVNGCALHLGLVGI